jgi:hypothetical protein
LNPTKGRGKSGGEEKRKKGKRGKKGQAHEMLGGGSKKKN